jgi:hypothetical protein
MGESGIDRVALVLEAGRAIRPYLRDLVGSQAERIDGLLSVALNREDQNGADAAILDALEELPPTRDWVSAFWRAGGIPPEVVKSVQPDADSAVAEQRVRIAMLGGGAPPGDPVLVIPGLRYACPKGDEVWYRMDASQRVPTCSTHRMRLKREPLKTKNG